MFCFLGSYGQPTTTVQRLHQSLVRAIERFHSFVCLLFMYLGVAPNGLFTFRSKLFGGISAEVSTIFNESTILEKFKRT